MSSIKKTNTSTQRELAKLKKDTRTAPPKNSKSTVNAPHILLKNSVHSITKQKKLVSKFQLGNELGFGLQEKIEVKEESDDITDGLKKGSIASRKSIQVVIDDYDQPKMFYFLQLIDRMPSSVKFKKAARHWHDAFQGRTPKHYIDFFRQNGWRRMFLMTERSKVWKSLMLLFAYVYIFLTMFEPINQRDGELYEKGSMNFRIIFYVELCLLVFWVIDIVFVVAHNYQERVFKDEIAFKTGMLEDHTTWGRMFRNLGKVMIRKWIILVKELLIFYFLVEFIVYYALYPDRIERYSRILRSRKVQKSSIKIP